MASRPSPAPVLCRRTFLRRGRAGRGCARDRAVAATAGATARHRRPPPRPRRTHHRARAPTAPSTPPTAARFVVTGPTTKRRLALTFHTNGDLGLADQLLDVLAARHVKMTSFIVGDWLDANPDMATRIAAGGHEFANHTYTHPTFGRPRPRRDGRRDRALSRRARPAHRRSGGLRSVRRAPTTAPSRRASRCSTVAADAGYRTVLGFDVDPFDYDDPGAEVVVQRTLAAVAAGLDREPPLRTRGHRRPRSPPSSTASTRSS